MSGATVSASPLPKTTTAGSTVVRYDTPGSIRVINSSPMATTHGPTVIGKRGPIRCARAPARAENSNMMMVSGNSDAPASNGE